MHAKKRLASAMRNLLREHAFKDITLDMLFAESDVSKSTFYRCFKDKEDLLRLCYGEDMERMFAEIVPLRWADLLAHIIDDVNENRRYYRNLFQAGNFMRDFILEHCVNSIEREYKKRAGAAHVSEDTRAIITFYSAGCVSILNEWTANSTQQPAYSIRQALLDAMPSALGRYLL
jgi:AcrR family transcriptional regulator